MRQKIDCKGVQLFALLLMMFISSFVNAQKTVTGTVTNSKDNSPLGFATVTVKGTNVATATDASGKFSIKVPEGKNTLVISSVGFDDLEVDVSSSTAVTISLKKRKLHRSMRL